MKRNWKDQIVIDPDLHHGDACIKGTRIPVTMIVGSLADGLTEKRFSQLTRSSKQSISRQL